MSLTREEVVEGARLIAEHFGVPVPRVQFTQSRQSLCNPIHGLKIGLPTRVSWDDFLCHEMAHWTRFHRYGPPFRPFRYHDYGFYTELRQVLRVWYDDDTEAVYSWTTEYVVLYNFAFRDGLVRSPHKRAELLVASFAEAANNGLGIGSRVSYVHRGRLYTGTIRSWRAGCRVNVQLDFPFQGRALVPPHCLKRAD